MTQPTCKFREFIEDDNGRGSASRLNMVIGVIVGSITVLWFTYKENLGGEIFATYMLATGGVYGFGKWRESVERVEQTKADSPNPPPVIVPPLGPTTTINVAGRANSEEVKAKDVAIEAKGSVSVNTRKRPNRKG